jgi:hypothetical protein
VEGPSHRPFFGAKTIPTTPVSLAIITLPEALKQRLKRCFPWDLS